MSAQHSYRDHITVSVHVDTQMENQYKITVIVFSSLDVRTQVLQTNPRSQKSAGRTLTAYDDITH